MAELVEQGARVVEGEQRRRAVGAAREVAGVVDDGALGLGVEGVLGAHDVHPRA